MKQDLLLGVQDLFSIFVPGIILMYLLLTGTCYVSENNFVSLLNVIKPSPHAAQVVKPLVDNTGSLFIFTAAVAAFFVGSIIRAMSTLLDFLVDKPIEKLPDVNIKLPFVGEKSFFGMKKYHDEAKKLKAQAITNEYKSLPWTTKSFWWHYIKLKVQQFSTELDRIEAVQKLFRSLVIVFLILAGLYLYVGNACGSYKTGITYCLIGACVSFCFYVYYRGYFLYRTYRIAIFNSIFDIEI